MGDQSFCAVLSIASSKVCRRIVARQAARHPNLARYYHLVRSRGNSVGS
jgi:hypothetical protein